jgi:Lsr2
VTKTVNVVVADDLDGSPGAETVAFGFDGHSYEIELGKQPAAAFTSGPRRAGGRSCPEERWHGGVRSFGPEYVHEVRNESAWPAASIHAHPPPLSSMRRYGGAAGGILRATGGDRLGLSLVRPAGHGIAGRAPRCRAARSGHA